MNNFIKKGITLIILITLFSFIIIDYNALLHTEVFNYLNTIIDKPEFVYWFVTIMLFLFIFILFKIINRFNDKKRKILKGLLIAILLIIQTILLFNLHLIPMTDSYVVIDQAKAIAAGLDKMVDYDSITYWTQYSNNNFCLLLLIGLFKIFGLFNLINSSALLIVFNILMVDLAIYFTYKTALKIKDEEFALKILLLCVLNPINYLFIFWSYTCIYSWVFTIGIVYLAFIIKEEIKKRQQISNKSILLIIMAAIIALVGYFLRPSMVIPLTALLVVFLIYLICHKNVIIFIQKNLKRILIILFLVFFVILFGYKFINYNINKVYPDDSKTFPITHWIMMGLHGDGSWRMEDELFTLSFETKEEKVHANLGEMKKTLSEYGVSGFINHLFDKLPVSWSSNYNFRIENVSEYSAAFQMLTEKSDVILLYTEAFRLVIFLLVTVNLVFQLKERKFDYRFLFTLILFGTILFYLIWEAKNEYSLPFVSFMIILAGLALDKMTKQNITIKPQNLRLFKTLSISFIVVTVLMLIALYSSFTDKISDYNKYQLKSPFDVTPTDWIEDTADHKVIKQEFYASGAFNNITLNAKKITDGDAKYKIELYSKNKKVNSFEISGDDVVDDSINLKFDCIYPKQREKYIIKIIYDRGYKDSISFGSEFTRFGDMYAGDFWVGSEKKASDLNLVVYYNYQGTYMAKWLYIVMSFIIVLTEIWMFRYLLLLFKSK